jgi:hypothetical protein
VEGETEGDADVEMTFELEDAVLGETEDIAVLVDGPELAKTVGVEEDPGKDEPLPSAEVLDTLTAELNEAPDDNMVDVLLNPIELTPPVKEADEVDNLPDPDNAISDIPTVLTPTLSDTVESSTGSMDEMASQTP